LGSNVLFLLFLALVFALFWWKCIQELQNAIVVLHFILLVCFSFCFIFFSELKKMSESSVEWPIEVSEEEKATFLLKQAAKTKKRFGNLNERKKILPPNISEKDVVNRKVIGRFCICSI
jgi:hypothetical protein